ncbi:MAG: hypothetical protein ABW321_16255 [Polyangiales bacterium]
MPTLTSPRAHRHPLTAATALLVGSTLLGATLPARSARADQVAAPAAGPTASQLAPAPPGEGAPAIPVPVDDPEPGELEATPPAPAASLDTPGGVAAVTKRLDAARQERADASRLLPLLTLSIGTASVLTAATAGSIHAFGCAETCDTPNWVALVVVAGSAVTTLGAIWLLRRSHDIHQLDSNVYHLERELERVRLSSRLSRDSLPTRGGTVLSLRF